MPNPVLAAALVAATTLSLWADARTEQIKEECAAYAVQESVPAEELDAYMKECMQSMNEQYQEDAVGTDDDRGMGQEEAEPGEEEEK